MSSHTADPVGFTLPDETHEGSGIEHRSGCCCYASFRSVVVHRKDDGGDSHDRQETHAMNSRELTALAKRCSAATAPDRALDAAICAIARSEGSADSFPYTANFDHAASLVPAGMQRLVRDHDGKADVDLDGAGAKAFASVHSVDLTVIHGAYGHSMALAMCAAALHARAALAKAGDD